MNRTFLVAAAVGAALAASSCGLNQLSIPLSASEMIAGGVAAANQPFTDDGSAQDAISSSFSSNGVKTFQSADLTTGTLSVVSTNTSFEPQLSSFTVSISAMGQPTVEVAHVDPTVLATKATSYPLVIDSVALKPYIDAGTVSFSAAPMFSTLPEFSMTLSVDMNLHVQIF